MLHIDKRLPENISFTGLFVITLITPPIASEPYKADEAPFTTSILSIFPTETLDKSKTPEVLPQAEHRQSKSWYKLHLNPASEYPRNHSHPELK